MISSEKLASLAKSQEQAATEAFFRTSREALIRATREEYPVGSLLCVQRDGVTVNVVVTGHSRHWWDSPGQIFGLSRKHDNELTFFSEDIVSVIHRSS